MNRIDEHFAALESEEEVESRKAVPWKFRNRVIVGSVIIPAVKWSLIAIGAATVIGCVTSKKDNNEETEYV